MVINNQSPVYSRLMDLWSSEGLAQFVCAFVFLSASLFCEKNKNKQTKTKHPGTAKWPLVSKRNQLNELLGSSKFPWMLLFFLDLKLTDEAWICKFCLAEDPTAVFVFYLIFQSYSNLFSTKLVIRLWATGHLMHCLFLP